MTTHSLIGLKTIREDLKVRAVDIAARIGCTMTTYYRYENGKRRIFFDHALAIAQMLQVDVNMLTRVPTIDERAELWKRGARQIEGQGATAAPDLTGTVVAQATQEAFVIGAEQLGDEPQADPAPAVTSHAEPESVAKDPALAELVAKWDFPADEE